MKLPEVNITRRYYCPPEKIWHAIADGFLFLYTGAIKEKTNSDFRVGGKIYVEWKPDLGGGSMQGEFTEITPHTKITFTWNTNEVKDSSVYLEIKDLGAYCELNLLHIFPKDVDTKEYDFGWDDAMYDLKKHIYRGEA